jgi:hypothetical protein
MSAILKPVEKPFVVTDRPNLQFCRSLTVQRKKRRDDKKSQKKDTAVIKP